MVRLAVLNRCAHIAQDVSFGLKRELHARLSLIGSARTWQFSQAAIACRTFNGAFFTASLACHKS